MSEIYGTYYYPSLKSGNINQLTIWCQNRLSNIKKVLRYLKQSNVNCFIEMKHNPSNAEVILEISDLSRRKSFRRSFINRQLIIYNKKLYTDICDICTNRFHATINSCNCRKHSLIINRSHSSNPFDSLIILVNLDNKFIKED